MSNDQNDELSAPDSRLIYDHFGKDWSVANMKEQVVRNNLFSCFPKKKSDGVLGSFSHVFSVCH